MLIHIKYSAPWVHIVLVNVLYRKNTNKSDAFDSIHFVQYTFAMIPYFLLSYLWTFELEHEIEAPFLKQAHEAHAMKLLAFVAPLIVNMDILSHYRPP